MEKVNNFDYSPEYKINFTKNIKTGLVLRKGRIHRKKFWNTKCDKLNVFISYKMTSQFHNAWVY